MNVSRLFFCGLCVFLTGCQKYYLTLYQENIDENSLASSVVGTPDPRRKDPPKGQKVILEWQVPKELLEEKPSLHFDVIYKDYSEAHFVYPVPHKAGYVVYSLIGEEYKKTRGLLAYRADIQTEDGKVFRSWTHQLWVNVIRLDQESGEEEEEEVSSVEAPPLTEEEESATFFPPDQ